jgi:hypothetical protein
MGIEAPIGNMTIVCKWEIIHRNEMWQKQKVCGQVQKYLIVKGCTFKTIVDKRQ